VQDYKTDVLYISTIAKNGGRLSRLVMRQMDDQEPFAFGDGMQQRTTTPEQWAQRPFYEPFYDANKNGSRDPSEPGQPISGKPILGFDGSSFWVYFGTGKMNAAKDLSDFSQQSFYGLKEPMQWELEADKKKGRFLFSELTLEPQNSDRQGQRGLLKTDDILLEKGPASLNTRKLLCRDQNSGDTVEIANDLWCLPKKLRLPTGSGHKSYFSHPALPNLKDYVRDHPDANHLEDSCSKYNKSCVDGWYRDFRPYENGERFLGGGNLLSGLLSFFTRKPREEGLNEIKSYFYALHYQTGTPWLQESTESTLVDPRVKITFEKSAVEDGAEHEPITITQSKENKEDFAVRIYSRDGQPQSLKTETLPENNLNSGRVKWREITEIGG
jgi:hypothetical protein